MAKHKVTCPVPSGTLLVIGGAENKGAEDAKGKQTPGNFQKLEILNAFIKLTGKNKPVIEIITSASTEGSESFNDYKKAFHELGISNPGHIHQDTRQEVLDDKDGILSRLQKADAVFFTGGDQLKYTHLYGGTPFLVDLKNRYINEKIVIAGTSAGAMAMSTPMIYAGNNEVQELGGMIKVTTGLEFLKDVCIDTHFVHRSRFIRMAQVIVTNPSVIGCGIEEDTAMIVSNGLDVEVIGTGTIIIIEGQLISGANIKDFTSEVPVTMRDLKVHVLSGGDNYKIPQSNPPHF